MVDSEGQQAGTDPIVEPDTVTGPEPGAVPSGGAPAEEADEPRNEAFATPPEPAAPRPAGVPTKFCFACGTLLDARAELCPSCGIRQMPPPGQSIDSALGRSRIVAALLGIFLGIFGIHKFYLGKTGQGLVYLVFFWTVIPAILGLIEGIWYLTMSDREFQARYPYTG